LAETFAAEPGIGSKRTQGQVVRTLFDLDLMDPNGLGPMGHQDILREGLLLGVTEREPII
jgi:hypothetical protein